MNPIAYEPRRPVPWNGLDVALLLIISLLLPFLVLRAAHAWFPVPAVDAAQKAAAPIETGHPLGRVLAESRSVWPLLLGAAIAIVIAPIVEELLFRLLLQGWLESLERRLRRRLHLPRRLLGAAPIAIVATLFALIHYRIPEPRQELSTILYSFNVWAIASLLTIVVLVCWLKFLAKATPVDLGVDRQKLQGDFRLGLVVMFLVLVPTFLARAAVFSAFPSFSENPWADPLFLLPLAATLGFLYYRTHRIVPAVALHMAFNAVSTLMALMAGT